MYRNTQKILDKPFQTYDQQIDLLKYRGLVIADNEKAKELLAHYSYYDLINGYKECFMKDKDTFIEGTTVEGLYQFHLLDKGIQNILFLYSTYVENSFKTKFAYIVAKNISEDEFIYINEKFYSKKDKEKLNKALRRLRQLCDINRIEVIDNPTKYYIQNHNHIPPWILFKNATFSTCIDLASLLRNKDKSDLINAMVKVNIADDYKFDFFYDSLTTIRKFRNAIAHNLKFITKRIEPQQRITFKQMLPEFKGTLLFDDRDGGKRCLGDPFSMIIALVSLIHDNKLLQTFFADLGQQMSRFQNIKYFELYCNVTGIPEDILIRGTSYLNSKNN